jgi:UDP-glucose 4-epimerase
LKVLVSGGAGFIGSHLVQRLLGDGHEVRVFDNLSTGRRSNLARLEGVELVEADLRAVDAVRAAVRGVEAVFHVAALPSVARSWQDPLTSLAVNAQGTANLVEAAAAAGVHALIYSSSSSVYGDQPAERKSEELEPRPISPYGFAKLLGEKIALAHARDDGLRVVALRYFNVFGPRQDPDSPYSALIPLFIKHALAGSTATIYGDGHQSRDFTYVANVVDANLLALHSTATGIAVNVACGESRSVLDLVGALAGLNGHALRLVHAPPREGDIRKSLADLMRARTVLGYRPRVTFEEGLRLTYDAFRAG